MTTAIALFDLDGTITQRDTYKEMLVFGLIKRPWRAFLVFLSAYDFILHKLEKRTNTYVKQKLLQRIFGGLDRSSLVAMSRSYAHFLLKYGVKKQALAALQQHVENGTRIVLVSASFDFYVNEIAKLLPVDEVICTKAEFKNDQLTGFLDGENCHGEQKIVRIHESINLDDYNEIFSYSDHHSDVPLLMLATTSYAVCPTAKLRAYMEKTEGNILMWN
jgi:HAD superfamily hydrolase (TIGR01490 family)